MEEAGGIRKGVVEEVVWEGGGRGRSLELRECKRCKKILRFAFYVPLLPKRPIGQPAELDGLRASLPGLRASLPGHRVLTIRLSVEGFITFHTEETFFCLKLSLSRVSAGWLL